MAMPVIRGRKSDTRSSPAPGHLLHRSDDAGRQGAAGRHSHDLGQNFGKAFDVKFQTKKAKREYVWQTSWGVSTRLIGGLVMTHSDDDGLICRPSWRRCRR
jgi:prolyl-tRNA synthetase